MCRHRLDSGEESPLIVVRAQITVHENTATPFTGSLLQWQCNQVAETTFGHRILIGKQPVIGLKLELPGPGTGMADDGWLYPGDVHLELKRCR